MEHNPMTILSQTITPLPAILDKLRAIEVELSATLIERESVIHGALLALIARQHVMLLGAPGTGKSLLVRAVAQRISSANRFELLLTKFTTPEELFGPLSITALQDDRYARVLDGRLATAHLAFIDEVGKAGSAILNALLALMNERKIHDDGREVPCPLVTLFGASNELPAGDELAAMFDRFLLRYEVRTLTDAGFNRLLTAGVPSGGYGTTVTLAELALAQDAADAISIPDSVAQTLSALRAQLREQGVEASDRRWCAALGLLQASALMMGRDHVNADDLEILTDVLWRRLEDRPLVAKAVARAGNPVRARVVEVVDEAVTIHADTMRQLGGDEPDAVQRAAMTANSRLKGILTELGRLRDSNPGADTARIDAAIDRVRELNGEVVRRGFAL
jgi:MoxR-like ATPase